MTNTLQLELPARSAPGRDAFDSNPAKVKIWLGNLPMANTGEATRQLYAAMTEMNRQTLPGSQRFKTLELIGPSVEYLTDQLRKHFDGQPLPLSETQNRIALLARSLVTELATGYKIVGGRAGRPGNAAGPETAGSQPLQNYPVTGLCIVEILSDVYDESGQHLG